MQRLSLLAAIRCRPVSSGAGCLSLFWLTPRTQDDRQITSMPTRADPRSRPALQPHPGSCWGISTHGSTGQAPFAVMTSFKGSWVPGTHILSAN